MEERENYKKTGMKLASLGLDIGAFKINPKDPFLWYSGTHNPLYSNHNVFLFDQEARRLIVNGFLQILSNLSFCSFDAIACSSASATPYGYRIAELLDLPFFLIADNNDDPHIKNKKENVVSQKIKGKSVILVEGLISTGENNASTVNFIREIGGICDYCLSVFDCDLPVSKKIFLGEIDFINGKKLSSPCSVKSLISYLDILDIATDKELIDSKEKEALKSWVEKYPIWGRLNGFY